MKKKCILCAFFKNMWKDIAKSFHVDWKEFFKMLALAIGVIIFLFICTWLASNYAETIKLIFSYSCFGILVLFGIAGLGLSVFMFCKWLWNLYIKSKAECE